jgi:hypothetical protein
MRFNIVAKTSKYGSSLFRVGRGATTSLTQGFFAFFAVKNCFHHEYI